jgi:hypothetical protein
MARPAEYDAETIDHGVSAYVQLCKEQNYLPSIEGLAVHLCVARATLYDWADSKSERYHEEFSDIFEQLKARTPRCAGESDRAKLNSGVSSLKILFHVQSELAHA